MNEERTEHRSRRALVVFVVRLVALGGLAVSCVLTIGEDRKEVRMVAEPAKEPDPDVDARALERANRPKPPRNFVFGDAGVVIDTATNLAWQHEPPPERFAWEPAKAYCQSLALDGGGWRLPSRPELLTVMKYAHDPFLADHDWYWSADVGVREGTAWGVGIDSWLNGNPVETKSRVRCVREARGAK